MVNYIFDVVFEIGMLLLVVDEVLDIVMSMFKVDFVCFIGLIVEIDLYY